MFKTDKVLRIKSHHGRTMQVVREHYLREEVPCYSQYCLAHCNNDTGGKLSILSSDVTHYVVPDCQVARNFLELLEFPELQGIIFMQTVVHSVQHEAGRRTYRRLQALIRDVSRDSIVFHNEFQKYCYQARQPGESLTAWQARSVYEACSWYYNHLAGQLPIVMVTTDPKVVEMYGSKMLGVYVITVEQYLKNFCPDLSPAHDLYESLAASLQQTSTGGKGGEYSGYLPLAVLVSGIKSGSYIQGSLQVNRHNSQNEAFVRRTGVSSKEGSSESDILVSCGAARNRAVHGDTVVVELLPRSQWRERSMKLNRNDPGSGDDKKEDDSTGLGEAMPTGRVVGILQRNWRDYVACFAQDQEGAGQQKKAGKVLVIPYDWRIPKVRISTRQVDSLRDHRILVRIDSWEVDSQYPNGHFVRSMGPVGDLETEIQTILLEHDVSTPPFTEAQMKELPVNSKESPWLMEDGEIGRRRDLRESHLIFSIDPKGCEDVDDTLSVKKLANGHIELGVHIADVTHFVKPGSLTDLEGRSRSTTVYLADRRYDMLPAILSADLCSLISNVDRYAMSVIWELDEAFEVVDVWYGQSIIRSSYKLFYEIAQAMVDGEDDESLIENIPELQGLSEEETVKRLVALKWSVKSLMDVANGIRGRRTQGGGLELESMEVQVQIESKTKAIEDLVPKQPLEIHETIAECMIFANHWVAKKICEAFPNQALLRHHPLPRQEHFETLVKCAATKGFTVHTQTNKDLAESLDRCQDPNDANINKILRTLATQAMSNAAYFSTGSLARDQFFHYGLALDHYTHFTSPIRRYADVIVHRLLLAAIGVEESSSLLGNKDLQELSQHINQKHREAQHAQKASVELFQALFFKDKSPEDECCTVDAVIFQIRANGVLVVIPRYGMKGAVYLKNKDGLVAWVTDARSEWVSGSLVSTASNVTITSSTGSGCQVYNIFDHVTVHISVQQSHAHAGVLRLDLLSNARHVSMESSSDAKQQKREIIKEVRSTAEEGERSRSNVDLGPHFEKWKALYGQTQESHSFYTALQTISDMARLDI